MRSDKDAIQALKQTVYPTLFAKHEGYSSIAHLLSDLMVDQNLNGEVEARKLGFESFREFLHSEEMATIAFVDNDENGNENGDECTRQSRTKRTLIFAWNK
ncbi:hypothetical protein AAVH_41248 [Aphelenchoides avenae]|nr:hypothetical protein AAVH_41248 [Aphelenchus avenae]